MTTRTDSPAPLVELSADELARTSGGAHRGGLFGFFDDIYKKLVFGVAGHIGGDKLATKMYGAHTSASDKKRARAAVNQYLAAGHKLPKGVPNLFG